MEKHFQKIREGIIGINEEIQCPDGKSRKIVYADWIASGRLYAPIEDRLRTEIMPLVANTHTETSTTGMAMTHAYHTAQEKIKDHVNAGPDDLGNICTAVQGQRQYPGLNLINIDTYRG